MVSPQTQAEHCFILTDVNGLYTANPRTDPQARLVRSVQPRILPQLKRALQHDSRDLGQLLAEASQQGAA